MPYYLSMTDDERHDAALAGLIELQKDAARQLREVLEAAIDVAGKIDTPLGSPVRGYDLDDIVATLRDLLPDQTEAEIKFAADCVLEGSV